MIKKSLLTLSLVGLFGGAFAQTAVQPCATDEVQNRLRNEFPEIARREAALNNEIRSQLQTLDFSKLSRTTDADGGETYYVPLVFHIIHNFGSEYVSDDAVRACVARINTMYNKRNADTADVIAPFKGFINNSSTRYIGNARIMFFLPSIDPDGNPTNGITRRRTYLTSAASDFAKYDQWAPSSYINIWLIRAMNEANKKAAAYAYKPATGEVIPYYDGIIGMAAYVSENDYTFSHELGHVLNLDHTWGGTNDPAVGCGDDEVDDTPLTKGHAQTGCTPASLYDTACLYTRNKGVGKLRIDSFVRTDKSIALMPDTSTQRGIAFKCRTASSIDSMSFYPVAAIGSTYIVGLFRNDVLIDTEMVVSTVINAPQRFTPNFKLPPGDTSINYKVMFTQNPGALKDTATPFFSGTVQKGENGTVLFKNWNSVGYYNFFYDWKITYGFYRIYERDSLVDYPDTANSQNVMDYTYCSKMFTAGQAERMRAALTATGTGSADRANLWSAKNLTAVGKDVPVNLAPEATISHQPIINTSTLISQPELSYFMCSENARSEHSFVFQNRTWKGVPTSINWTLSNNATVPTSTSNTVTTRFKDNGWATVQLTATNANGTTTATTRVYVADPNARNPIGAVQDFNDDAENQNWPIFNYFENRYKWEFFKGAGTFDNYSIRYRSFDDRTSLKDVVAGDPGGDYDDFFTPAFDLSKLNTTESGGSTTNGNLNFMYSGAYATNNKDYMKDTLEIAYSLTCGGTWTVLTRMTGAQLQTVGSVPITSGDFVPTWADWKAKSIDLKVGTTPIRDNKVFFRFRYKPSSRPYMLTATTGRYASANNFYIDRINFSNNPLAINEMMLGDKQVALAPNPTSSNAYVLFQKPNGNVTIRVMDVTGKVVYALTTKVDQSNARVEIPAERIAAKGVYMVNITGDDNLNKTEKLVVF